MLRLAGPAQSGSRHTLALSRRPLPVSKGRHGRGMERPRAQAGLHGRTVVRIHQACQVLLIEELDRQGLEAVFLKAPSMKSPEDQFPLQFQGIPAPAPCREQESAPHGSWTVNAEACPPSCLAGNPSIRTGRHAMSRVPRIGALSLIRIVSRAWPSPRGSIDACGAAGAGQAADHAVNPTHRNSPTPPSRTSRPPPGSHAHRPMSWRD